MPFAGPFMRGDDDNRNDTDVKADIHRVLTEMHGYRIVGAIDDRPRVIRLWQSLDIPVEIVHRDDWVTQGESYPATG